ncbi:hypothetical protein PIIN_05424 [Serendipita indica DSM 11827]|uniref:Uncharacterized protein n=1 Tax=Serendipita indica (strain DSM 11827) TaxID=1109443 RepID=G4TJK6_SERID|nr:hypothetical protein PIIN_05424 [Serendipita indica DSM 11827]
MDVLTLPRQHPPARTRSVWLRSLLTANLFPVKLSDLPPQGVAGAACIPREDSNVVSHEPLRSVSPLQRRLCHSLSVEFACICCSKERRCSLEYSYSYAPERELQQIKGKRTESSGP